MIGKSMLANISILNWPKVSIDLILIELLTTVCPPLMSDFLHTYGVHGSQNQIF